MFMGFTNCGHVCPTTMVRLRAIASALELEVLESEVNVLFVSVDPDRDTPEVIARYVQGFNAGFTGVTGTPAELEKLANTLGAPFFVQVSDERYIVDHSSAIFVINPDGDYAAVISPPHDIALIVSALTEMLPEA